MHPHCNEFARLKEGAGWNNARTASELGLHPTVIWKYLNGVTHPSIQVLRLLAGLTSQPLALPGEGPIRFQDGPRWLEEWESDVVVALRRIEPGARKRVITALHEMIEAITTSARYTIKRPRRDEPKPDKIPSTAELVATIASDLIPAPSSAPASGDASKIASTHEAPPLPIDALPESGRVRGTHRSGRKAR